MKNIIKYDTTWYARILRIGAGWPSIHLSLTRETFRAVHLRREERRHGETNAIRRSPLFVAFPTRVPRGISGSHPSPLLLLHLRMSRGSRRSIRFYFRSGSRCRPPHPAVEKQDLLHIPSPPRVCRLRARERKRRPRGIYLASPPRRLARPPGAFARNQRIAAAVDLFRFDCG